MPPGDLLGALKESFTSGLMPPRYGQRNCLPLWQTSISWSLEHRHGISIPYAPIKSMPWGKKAGWITQVFWAGCGTRPLQHIGPLYHGQMVTAGVEGGLAAFLIPDVHRPPMSCSASCRRGSVSSGIVMAKLTVLHHLLHFDKLHTPLIREGLS